MNDDPKVQELATFIHQKYCHFDHTAADCGFPYERDWDGDRFASRARYYNFARRVLREFGGDLEAAKRMAELFAEADYPQVEKA